MRKLFVVLFCLFYISSLGQDLLKSRITSVYTYIFKISDKEAETIYKNSLYRVDSSYFHTLVDSVLTNKWVDPVLMPGHYLMAYAEKHTMNVEMASIQDFDIRVLNNNSDLCIQVYDSIGNVISDAHVFVKNKNLKYDQKSKTYRSKKSNKQGLIKVKYKDQTAFYDLKRQYNNSGFKRLKNKIVYRTPIRYVWIPVYFVGCIPIDGIKSIIYWHPTRTIRQIEWFFINTYKKIACIFDDYYCDDDDYDNNETPKYNGYMVFNKPKYLPKDTVKLKAYIVNKKAVPVDKELDVLLKKKWNKQIKLTSIKPYNKGGYTYEFYLHDSLSLQLDQVYEISLEYNGEELISGSFKYEDYELKKNELSIRTNYDNHYKGKGCTLFVKGTDENDMNLLDATFDLTITNTRIDKYFSENIFVPDTLWTLSKKLEPVNETEVIIPDSLFPPVNLEYSIEVNLKTSDNESLGRKKTIQYYHKNEDILFKLNNDSIEFTYELNGASKPIYATISGVDNFENTFDTKKVSLPFKDLINPYYSYYYVRTDSLKESLEIDEESAQIQCMSERSRDSLHIVIANPRKIPFNYFIYKLNSEISRGFSDSTFTYKIAVNSVKNYYVSLQYLWGGRIIEEDYEIALKDKGLNILLNQPAIVYPGQKAQIDILVTDKSGKPAPNVDLTAFGLTKKFKYNPPALPDLSKSRKKREVINKFSIKENEYDDKDLHLNYEQWKVLAEIDSIEYFKFIYPENKIYTYSYPNEDSITQFAPFVLNDGIFKPIHVIYVDRSPIYFSWSTNVQPYSFKIRSGYHEIELRTRDKSIIIDSLYFPENKKTIFSLNDTLKLHNVSIIKLYPELTYYEKDNLYKYIFAYRHKSGEQFAYLKQDNRIIVLNPKDKSYLNSYQYKYNYKDYYSKVLTGPVFNDNAEFKLINDYSTAFDFEPFFEYDFSLNLLKMRSVEKDKVFPRKLGYETIENITDKVYTEENLKEDWLKYLDNKRLSTAIYSNPSSTKEGNGSLLIELNKPDPKENLTPLNILIFEPSNPEFTRIYPGKERVFHDLKEAYYRLIVFYQGSKYNVIDSVKVKPNGLNYLKIDKPELFKKDKFSSEVSELIQNYIYKPEKYTEYDRQREVAKIRKSYQSEFSFSGTGHKVSGRVVGADDNLSIPGVSVMVKGASNIGTTTDIDGYYSLNIPGANNTLVFSFVGMKTIEVPVENRAIIDVALEGEMLMMEEVIVVAYGISRKQSITASVVNANSVIGLNALQGKLAGVSVTNSLSPGSNTNIVIRGNSSINASSEPLFIINGIPYSGGDMDINPEQIESIEVIKDASMASLYGVRALNGVVIITTKDKSFNAKLTGNIKGAQFDPDFMETASQASSIRDNFSDYAFWQPKLITNSMGKASFEVTFPDDVTNWSTYVLAMNGKKQAGQTQNEIKSFKPLMAQLALPRFLIEGDSIYAIGKVLNYTADSIELTSNFEVNGSLQFTKPYTCIHSIIDSLQIVPDNTDTIKAKYYIEKPDGYFDGEQREIPVFSKGLEQTKGDFYVLDKDTTINLEFSDSLGAVELYARMDELDVIDVELKRLKNYKYLCNEQLASKLKAYLAEEGINKFKNKTNKHTKDIKSLLKKLEDNQNDQGLWGWWNKSESSYWISTHVLEAVIEAKEHAYNVNINKTKITDHAIWLLESNKYKPDKIKLLYLLKLMGANVDYTRYIEMLEKNKMLKTLDKFRLIELKQMCKLDYDINFILNKKQTTLFGNIYFEASYDDFSVFENDVQLTLIAYKIIKQDSALSATYLPKIRNYFFEKRKKAYWGNTFETSQIIETILPDLLKDKDKTGKQEIVFSGSINKTVSEFPYSTKLLPGDKISIKKTGVNPIYLTTYQRFWNPEPNKKSNDFIITSHFENNSSILKAGKSEKLIVEVKILKDAEYVMIEVPIPAGCSYNTKTSWFMNEVHREYFKDQVSIFCSKLNKGSYKFEIDLMPRYNGKYTLNPAKIELMYFPTFNANNELKKVIIE